MYYDVFPPLLVGKSILQPWVHFHNYSAYCFLMVSSHACVDKYSKTKEDSYTDLQSFVRVWVCPQVLRPTNFSYFASPNTNLCVLKLARPLGFPLILPPSCCGLETLKNHLVCVPSFSTCVQCLTTVSHTFSGLLFI